MAMMRISRSTRMGRSPALLADEEDENLGAVSDSRRLRRLSCWDREEVSISYDGEKASNSLLLLPLQFH